MTSQQEPSLSAATAGTFLIGGDMPVARLGFGSMQFPGRNAFGPPRDADGARAVLRRAVDLGVTLIDTADAYGPGVSERLIGEALHPYRRDVVIATKGGFVRGRRGEWVVDGRPEHLHQAVRDSLTRLQLERIDLYQLHRIDSQVPLEDQMGALRDMQEAGLVRHVGLSEVTASELRAAQHVVPIVTVQNLFNLVERSSEDLVRYTAEHGIGFIPWFPLATGGLTRGSGALGALAQHKGVTASQIALAWLLQHSPNVLPIPGTSSVAHLEENVAAGSVVLSPEEKAMLDRAA
ncbi:aldo/keto reductase [Curtobacterium sp. MCBA15_008]|uniref:aldo/keto reductase n=1 Tax=Curtobacterium sp. MCBA15_008 TaxID=1898736 RepID=UPI0008DD056F|nr:aldo/keto reductase [Curtobacterium sp. MCBA15_008]OII06914.1 oxidoreductase [Curtobacterium sp. MCBA15_008]